MLCRKNINFDHEKQCLNITYCNYFNKIQFPDGNYLSHYEQGLFKSFEEGTGT